MKKAAIEMAESNKFSKIVVNDDLEKAFNELNSFVDANMKWV